MTDTTPYDDERATYSEEALVRLVGTDEVSVVVDGAGSASLRLRIDTLFAAFSATAADH
ncbi:hypothetical protein ACFVT5_36330 [Streptomyces sp. NPDC058001]|uniref:hypothetical protein n=1 Tax=Streptomyces sp. NPDC058001 TaxID=3346300 RepID=UPI0036E8E756